MWITEPFGTGTGLETVIGVSKEQVGREEGWGQAKPVGREEEMWDFRRALSKALSGCVWKWVGSGQGWKQTSRKVGGRRGIWAKTRSHGAGLDLEGLEWGGEIKMPPQFSGLSS